MEVTYVTGIDENPIKKEPPAGCSRRVLVTGGSGFVGQHLVAALGRRGELVRVLDIQRPSAWSQCDFIQGSILDREVVARAMDGVHTVYHLAGIAHLWTADRNDYDRVNHEGTLVLLAAAAAQGVTRFVHCSTAAILFPASGNGGETPTCVSDMSGPYTRSKFRAEQAALQAAMDGFPIVIVSPTAPIGPGDHNMTAPTAMLSLLARAPPRFVLDCMLNLVDVRDVANGMVLAAERGRPGERYVLGGENIGIRELIRRVGNLTGKLVTPLPIPGVAALLAGWVAEWFANHLSYRQPVATTEGVRIALRSVPLEAHKAMDELGYAPNAIDRALVDALAWLTSTESQPETFDVHWTPEMRRGKVRRRA
jgi:dihydroflavonol-4-reductase